MAKLNLDARNRKWTNQVTANLAEMLDESSYEESVAALIDDFEMDGLIPEEIRDGVSEMIYQDLREAYSSLEDKVDPLEWVCITDPFELSIDYGQIADAYMEILCKGSRSRKARPSKNKRPKARARKPARATSRRY